MRIVIEGVSCGPSWEKLEAMVQSCGLDHARLMSIRRPDGGANYRTYGTYALRLESPTTRVEIDLEVKP